MLLAALKERFAWQHFEYAIPPWANCFPYMLGGLTFVGLIVLIVTGIFLDQFFNPSPLAAHDSVLYIMTRVRLGNWIRDPLLGSNGGLRERLRTPLVGVFAVQLQTPA